MAKLLLTSTGFTNPSIGKEFLSLFEKPVSEIKIIFIPTASRTAEELRYVEGSKKELLKMGIKPTNLFVYNLDKKLKYEDVSSYDAIYVCGGNTFYLTLKMKEDGFDKAIIKLVSEGKAYVGVSAGSILAGPTINIATPFDPNDVSLRNLTGLNLTDKIVSPHYEDKEKEIIEKFKKEEKHPIIPLTNSQALLIINEKEMIIE